MIFDALALLRAELLAYVKPFNATADVALGSVAGVAGSKANQLLLTLVSVDEEPALKNLSPYQRNATGGFDVVNPPVYVNLYVLVSANYDSDNTYETALRLLAWAVQCFQRRTEFSTATVPTATGLADPRVATLRVSVDLYGLSFEKLNQLWGTLGGRQVPSVVYKVRVVEEQAAGQLGTGPAITSVSGRLLGVEPLEN